MKIAIIGGGSAGMISAHLICKNHDVTVYEKDSCLGGSIKTINLNISGANICKNIKIENGVTGFHYHSQKKFRHLIKSLDIPIRINLANVTSAIYLHHGAYFEIPSMYTLKKYGFSYYISKNLQLLKLFPGSFQAYKKIISPENIESVQELLMNLGQLHPVQLAWLRCSIMLAFSTPYSNTLNFPARQLANHYKNSKVPCWWSIPSGAYSYIQRILDLNPKIKTYCNVRIKNIVRSQNKIQIFFEDGSVNTFDKIIFACMPSEILKLLATPTDREIEYFINWKSIQFKTTAHTDDTLYLKYKKTSKTVCDYFLKENNDYGYNTYMNHIYGLPDKIGYNFSYNLDEYIKKESIISQVIHNVPVYEHSSHKFQKKILQLSGTNNTYYVGAYLDDGLQEGAMKTALLASQHLNGFVKSSL